MEANGSKKWTHTEYIDLITTINKLLLSQEQTTEKIEKLTSTLEKLVDINSIIPELNVRLTTLEKRVKNLEETKTDTFSFILKTVGSLIIIGAIYAFIIYKKG